jgi:hypothetical protein
MMYDEFLETVRQHIISVLKRDGGDFCSLTIEPVKDERRAVWFETSMSLYLWYADANY